MGQRVNMKSELKLLNVGAVKANFNKIIDKFFILDPKLSDLFMNKLKAF
jgi:hypothetical protein